MEYLPYGVTGVMTFQFYPAMREDVLTFWYCVPGPNIAFQFYPAHAGIQRSVTPVASLPTRYFNLTPHSAGRMRRSSRTVKLSGVSSFNPAPRGGDTTRDLTTMMKNWDDMFQFHPTQVRKATLRRWPIRVRHWNSSISPRAMRGIPR
jgi:hypothetical protein